MELEPVLSAVRMHVERLYLQKQTPALRYHNLHHTQQVVASCAEISGNYALDATQSFILYTAAWFHDVGHLYGYLKGHEEVGSAMMYEFMHQSEFEIDVPVLKAISRCINVTAMPSRPSNLPEEIICDADTYHFGTDEFRITDQLVHQEMQLRTGLEFPGWHRNSLLLLTNHHYFTAYCREKLSRGKEANLEYLRGLIASES